MRNSTPLSYYKTYCNPGSKPKRYKSVKIEQRFIGSMIKQSSDKIMSQIEAFAAKHGIEVSDVFVNLDYLYMYYIRPESDEEYNKRLKEWEKDVAVYKKELAKIEAQEKRQAAKAAKEAELAKKQEAARMLESLAVLVKDPSVKKLVQEIVK